MRLHELKDKVLEYEGLSLKPYFCPAGKLTIGIGRNLEDNGITKDEALFLMENDLVKVHLALQKSIANFDSLPKEVKEVLVHMAFNLGPAKLMTFKKKLLAIKLHDFEGAAKEMLDSKWAKQVGTRATELAKAMEGQAYQKENLNQLVSELKLSLQKIEISLGISQ